MCSFFTFSLNILLCLMLGFSNSKWSQVLREGSSIESFLTGFLPKLHWKTPAKKHTFSLLKTAPWEPEQRSCEPQMHQVRLHQVRIALGQCRHSAWLVLREVEQHLQLARSTLWTLLGKRLENKTHVIKQPTADRVTFTPHGCWRTEVISFLSVNPQLSEIVGVQ